MRIGLDQLNFKVGDKVAVYRNGRLFAQDTIVTITEKGVIKTKASSYLPNGKKISPKTYNVEHIGPWTQEHEDIEERGKLFRELSGIQHRLREFSLQELRALKVFVESLEKPAGGGQ